MARSFNVVAESPTSVEHLHEAFTREDYWRARIAAGAATTSLDSLILDNDGAVTVRVTQYLGRQLLPGPIAKFIPGELKLMHHETWRPNGDGHVTGEIDVSAAGEIGSGHAENRLAPAGDGSRLRSAVRVEVKIPLLGGKLEKSIGSSLTKSIPEILRFTTAWIGENA